jgi:hypothetical protein
MFRDLEPQDRYSDWSAVYPIGVSERAEQSRVTGPMRRDCQLMLTVALRIFCAVIVIGALGRPACGQQYSPPSNAPPPPPVLVVPPPPAPPTSGTPPLAAPLPAPPPLLPSFLSGLQFIAYPYLWLPHLDMTITTPLARAPQVNASAGAFQILGNLNNAPFMGAAEVRDGPFGVLADALHVPLGVPITTRNIFFSGGNTGVVLSIVTADFLYRMLDQPVQTIDAGLGFRHWGLSTDTILNGRAFIPTISIGRSGSFNDPLIAARYHRDFGDGFGLTAYGDVGGFGIAAHADWEIVGTLDYALKPWIDLHLGYRSLNVSYSESKKPIGFLVHLNGPIIAASLRF